MDDLKARIKLFMDELESKYLYKEWPQHIIEAGINEKEAHLWATEIGHVVDEYRSSLMHLADVLQESDPERIPLEVYEWAVGIQVVSVDEIESPMQYLEKQLEKYLPPEPDDEDEV